MRFILVLLTIFILFISSASISAVFAQSFKFQQANSASPAAQVGGVFDIKILVNTTGKQSLGGDAIVVFDSAKVSVKSAVTGNFYNVFEPHAIGGSSNKYLLSAWQYDALNPTSTTSDALFGTVTFNALAAGNATLTFDCTSGSIDSNIWDTTQTDMIKCSDLAPLTVNIGGGSGGPTSTPTPSGAVTSTPVPTSIPVATATPRPTSTPVPTSTPIPTNTPRPTISILPRTGTVEVTIGALAFGVVLTVVGLLVIL